jgi:hypothetical protein
MSVVKFSAPKEWENWLNIAFGVWICISPSILQFTDDATAVHNAYVVGFLIIVASVATFSSIAVLEIIIDMVLGGWLVASPWILGLANRQGSSNFVIVGAFVLALACYEFWQGYSGARRRT